MNTEPIHKCPYCGSEINPEDEISLSLEDSIKRESKGHYSMGLYEAKMLWKYKWVILVPLEICLILLVVLLSLELKAALNKPDITNTEMVMKGGSR